MSSLSRARIIVVGAGILGLATAAELTRRRARVQVFDPAGGRESASAAAAGMISPALEAAVDGATPERANLYRQAADRWPAFAQAFGLRLINEGADWLGPPEPIASRLAALDFAHEANDDRVHVPGEARIEVHGALARLAALLGSGSLVGRRVERIEGGTAVISAGERFEADAVVLAAGWAAGRIESDAAPPLDCISPLKGQIIELGGAGSDYVHRIVRGPGGYILPGRAGVIAGATMEPGRADTAVDAEAVEGLRRAAVDLAPELAGAAVVRSWAGVRGSTPDGLPLAGPTGGPFLALAPRRNGWLLAPLVADVVAAAIGEEPSPPHAEAFRPDRFDPA